jgi:DNA-binding MarR family transcriptional regulator
VCLTDAGRAKLVEADAAMESLEGEVLGALSPDERDQFRHLLSRALAGEPVEA